MCLISLQIIRTTGTWSIVVGPEEEEYFDPKRKEETSSEEDEVPLPQPEDMHVEFKKSSLPDRAKKPKIKFIPFRLLQESKHELCKNILNLE